MKTSTNKRCCQISHNEGHYQTVIWEMANIADMKLPAAMESGWHLDGNVLISVLTTLQPIPKACTAFVICGCKKNACSNNKCRFFKASYPCTNMCARSNDRPNIICNEFENEDYEQEADDLQVYSIHSVLYILYYILH